MTFHVIPNSPSTGRIRRIGIDLSILDQSTTGSHVYASNLYESLKHAQDGDFEIIALRPPGRFPPKNIFMKFSNILLEILWLNVLLPLKARNLRLDLLHMLENRISPVLKIPQICSIHDVQIITYPKGRNRFWIRYSKILQRYATRHAHMILCGSMTAKDEIVNLLGANPDKIEVIPYGITIRTSTPADVEAISHLKPYILFVGLIHPNKNLPALVEAFDMLVKTGRIGKHQLVIAGPPGRDYHRLNAVLKEKEDLADRVTLTGRISDSRLAALYENASLFVFPSFYEGFGFPPLEAMHFGVPVVASQAPCIPETLGDAALYFDPSDIPEMAKQIESGLYDSDLRNRLIKAGREIALTFTWEDTAERTLAAYRSFFPNSSKN